MKKIGLKRLGIFAVSAFSIALASCGGSSGGGESEIDFDKDDLADKYWFANDFVSDNYSQDDDLIVYWFERNGDLIKQEYGGREEKQVGFWDLDEKKLVISDATFGNGESIDWFLQKGTNSQNLVLSADNRRKLNCTTNIPVINDVTADAFIVNSVNTNGDITRYLQCRITGKSIASAKLLLSSGQKIDLAKTVEGTVSVFSLTESSINDLKTESFPENDDVKFYLKLDNGLEVKLTDVNDDKTISSLKNEQNYNQGTHVVKWTALDESDIYYNIEILDLNGKILFRSRSLSAQANDEMEIQIDKNVDSEFESLDDLEADKQYKVRINGVKYEDEINPSTSKHEDYNIQAKTIYSYSIIWS
ncbi:hypothetical protein [Ancylomarina sp.]|uniref:hypothetical protein n=1 Tax=Ancylomarina sp. TaxID=1970196 RepID=UPI0035676BEC